MGINSRSKGARNERKLADLFTKWTGRKFAKSPASGGLHWQSSFVHGDLVCTKEGHYFPFCIEAKSYNKIDFSHLLNPKIKNVDILDFWNQCSRDAKECNKIPILFMRYNGLPSDFHFVVIDMNHFNNLGILQTKTSKLIYHGNKVDLMIMTSPDFFKTNYKEIKQNAKDYLKKRKH